MPSMECAQRQLEKVLGVKKYHPQEKYFFRVKAGDTILYDLLGDDKDTRRATQECYQLLHHAHTYGLEKCLMIVGSDVSFLYAIEISFPSYLLQGYSNTMNILYDKYFALFYSPTLDDSFPMETITKVLEIKNRRKKGNIVSFHSFITNYRLWHSLNVNVDMDTIKFPLPPADGFLPLINAKWNLSKYPLDTLTKMFNNCK